MFDPISIGAGVLGSKVLGGLLGGGVVHLPLLLTLLDRIVDNMHNY